MTDKVILLTDKVAALTDKGAVLTDKGVVFTRKAGRFSAESFRRWPKSAEFSKNALFRRFCSEIASFDRFLRKNGVFLTAEMISAIAIVAIAVAKVVSASAIVAIAVAGAISSIANFVGAIALMVLRIAEPPPQVAEYFSVTSILEASDAFGA